MRVTRTIALLGGSALVVASASVPASAQGTPQVGTDAEPVTPGRVAEDGSTGVTARAAAPATEGDIIVTARRSEERLQDVPISITVFNQQQIQNRNIVTAGDLATYTPSLSANTRFGAESTSFAIRGFVQEGITSPSVAVYFADVVAPRANGGTTGGNGAGVGSLFDLQNVQVLKGPQGTLFGRNTTGGAVLLVPRKPTDALEGYVEGSLGNYDLRRVQAVLNAPLGDSVRVRLGIDRQKQDGYLRNISGIGPKDFADTDYVALRGSVVIDVTENLENYTIATYSRSNTNGFYPKLFFVSPTTTSGGATYRFADYAAQLASTPGYYDVSNGNPDAFQRIKQWGLINTTTLTASETLTVKNIISYQQFQQAYVSNINGDNGFDPAANAYNYAITIFADTNGRNISQSTFTEELQFQGRLGDDLLTYQVGGYYEIARPLDGFQHTKAGSFIRCTDLLALQCTDVRGTLSGIPGRVGAIADQQSRYRFRNTGLYAQATLKLTDQLSVTGGIRYTSDRTTGQGRVRRINFPAPNTPVFSCAQPVPLVQGGTSAQIRDDASRCNFERKAKSERPTWLIDLDYKPSDDVLLYAKYARGYRQGSVNVSSYGYETWGPEKVDSYEVGAKTGFRGAISGTFNVAAFYNNLSDQQVQIGGVPCQPADLIANPTQCPFAATAGAGIGNAGKSTIKGFEVDGAVTLFEGLSLSGGYTYLDTKLKSIGAIPVPLGFRSNILPAVGNALPLTPRHKFSVTGSYMLPIDGDIGEVSVSATYTHQSRQLNATTSGFPQNLIQPRQNNLNLNLNWNKISGSPVDLQLFATNVTKEKFRLQTVGGGANGFESAILNPPRMYGARVRYSFGH